MERTKEIMIIIGLAALIVLAGCALPSTGLAGESAVCASEKKTGEKVECGSSTGKPSQQEIDAAVKNCSATVQADADTKCAAFCKKEACNSGKATATVTGGDRSSQWSLSPTYTIYAIYDYSCTCYSGLTTGGGGPNTGGGDTGGPTTGGGNPGGPTTLSNKCHADATKAANQAMKGLSKKNATADARKKAYEAACGTCDTGDCQIINGNCVPCGEKTDGDDTGGPSTGGSGGPGGAVTGSECQVTASDMGGLTDHTKPEYAAQYTKACASKGACNNNQGTCGIGASGGCECIPKVGGGTGGTGPSTGGGNPGGALTGTPCSKYSGKTPEGQLACVNETCIVNGEKKQCMISGDTCICPGGGNTQQNVQIGEPERPGGMAYEPDEPYLPGQPGYEPAMGSAPLYPDGQSTTGLQTGPNRYR